MWVSAEGPYCGSWMKICTNREKGGICGSENSVLLQQSCCKQCGNSHWQLYTLSIFNWICCGTEPHTIRNSLSSFSYGFILFQQLPSPATPQLGLLNTHARSWQAHSARQKPAGYRGWFQCSPGPVLLQAGLADSFCLASFESFSGPFEAAQ